MKTVKIIILTLSLTLAGAAFAAGFGVSNTNASTPATATGSKSPETAISRLIAQADANKAAQRSVVPKSASALPKKYVVRSSAASKPTTSSFGDTGVSQSAFTSMVHNMMPLSPKQITTLHYLFSRSQKAASTYPGTPPKPTSSSVIVNLSPGAAPPVIRLRAGYVTSLVFLDATGQPWPIEAYDLGNPKAFNIQPNQPNGVSNTLLVQAIDSYKSGNLAVMLKGLDTPVMVTLLPGQRAVDYRVDLRLPGLGPNAKPMMNGLPNTSNPQLLTFLDGVPPSGAKALQVTGGQCQAWLSSGHLFLRTPLTVLSPSWMSTMSSPDGTHVYELIKTPVVLAYDRGQIVRLMIKGL